MWRAGLLVLVVGGPVRADEVERFYDEYEPHWARLVDHLWKNVSVAGTITYHDLAGRPAEQTTFTTLANDSVLLRRATARTPDGRLTGETVTLVTPDQAVQYERPTDQSRWQRSQTAVPWQSGRSQTQYYTLLTGDLNYFAVYGPDIGRGPNAYYRPAMTTLERATFAVTRSADGQLAEVRQQVRRRPGHVWVTRLRPSDALISSVEDVGQDGSSRNLIETAYTPAADGGLPFPATVRSRWVNRDGTETPILDVRYTEYRRHAPSADELDLGRLVGETPPDPGPRSLLPPRGIYLPPDPLDRATDGPLVDPESSRMSTQERYIRVAGLGVFMMIAALIAVWWRR